MHACGGCAECVCFMVGTCKYPQQKRSLYYTIIRGEIMVSAQATAAIDRFCPAFIGHDKLCLRWDVRRQHVVLKRADETLYMCWRVFSVILTEDLITLKCNSFYRNPTTQTQPCQSVYFITVVNNNIQRGLDSFDRWDPHKPEAPLQWNWGLLAVCIEWISTNFKDL